MTARVGRTRHNGQVLDSAPYRTADLYRPAVLADLSPARPAPVPVVPAVPGETGHLARVVVAELEGPQAGTRQRHANRSSVPSMTGVLGGRTAIVAGGGQGIGRGVALAMASAGANVVIAELKEPKAQAVAAEQEMKARTQEMRAKVVEAEAQVPQAMAEAFRSGNLGIMDYQRLKNIQADTAMRESIAGPEKSPEAR